MPRFFWQVVHKTNLKTKYWIKGKKYDLQILKKSLLIYNIYKNIVIYAQNSRHLHIRLENTY